jgi:hypothetical protein
MSDHQRARNTTRRELETEQELAPDYPHSHEQHYYQPTRPPSHMATYANYPPRQQYPPPPYPPYHGAPRNDISASPPSDGFHPPVHRYAPRRNPITPESSQMVPAEFMSPPSKVKRRGLSPRSHSLTPSKRARTGRFSQHFFVIVDHAYWIGCFSVESRKDTVPSRLLHLFVFLSYVMKFCRMAALSDSGNRRPGS